MDNDLVARPILSCPVGPPYQAFEIHPKAFTPRQCARIVSLGIALPPDVAHVEAGDGSEIDDPSIRRSRTSWIKPDDDSWWIFEKLSRVVERANRRYGFEVTGFGEDIQFTEYHAPGDFYAWHQDGLDGTLRDRKLSIVVQLTPPEEYEGGELQFFEVHEDYEPEELEHFTNHSRRQGSAVVFPSFEYHRVLPMRAGTRHSLVCWVNGPPFR